MLTFLGSPSSMEQVLTSSDVDRYLKISIVSWNGRTFSFLATVHTFRSRMKSNTVGTRSIELGVPENVNLAVGISLITFPSLEMLVLPVCDRHFEFP